LSTVYFAGTTIHDQIFTVLLIKAPSIIFLAQFYLSSENSCKLDFPNSLLDIDIFMKIWYKLQPVIIPKKLC